MGQSCSKEEVVVCRCCGESKWKEQLSEAQPVAPPDLPPEDVADWSDLKGDVLEQVSCLGQSPTVLGDAAPTQENGNTDEAENFNLPEPSRQSFYGQGGCRCYFTQDISELALFVPAEGSGSSDGDHEFRFSSGAVYSGQWKGRHRHGYGKQHWPDGAIYQGEWRSNHAEGRGLFTHSDGDVYIGEWMMNVAHGKGICYRKGRETYEGDWRNDLQDGFGVETVSEGWRYEGNFREGHKDGWGRYYWPDSSQYFGRWAKNSIKGQGTYVGSDGRAFIGTWHDSFIHGQGQYTWPDGRKYRGQYASDRKNGFGIFVWPDGRQYEGFWRMGQQHGHGKLTVKGVPCYGIWRAGMRESVVDEMSEEEVAKLDADLPSSGEQRMMQREKNNSKASQIEQAASLKVPAPLLPLGMNAARFTLTCGGLSSRKLGDDEI